MALPKSTPANEATVSIANTSTLLLAANTSRDYALFTNPGVTKGT